MRATRRRLVARAAGVVAGLGLLATAVAWFRGARELQEVLDEFERRGYGE